VKILNCGYTAVWYRRGQLFHANNRFHLQQ
jgi:hypothetical protein